VKAGRELDALVAERVMGWSEIDPKGTAMINDRSGQWSHDTVLGFSPNDTVPEIVPHYSTDIAAAWLVVDAMTDDDSSINDKKYSFGLEYSSVVDWVADFTPRRSHPLAREYEAFRTTGSDAAHAICLAALKAIGAP
jgi:hypothetical protein